MSHINSWMTGGQVAAEATAYWHDRDLVAAAQARAAHEAQQQAPESKLDELAARIAELAVPDLVQVDVFRVATQA